MSEWTTYDLERMAAGEIETPPEARDRVAALRAANEVMLDQYRVEDYAPRIRGAARPRTRAPVIIAVAVALLAAVVFARPAEDSGIRTKGPELKLYVYKRAPDGDRLLSAGETVAAGDLVQAKVALGEPAQVALYSVDGVGRVTPIDPPDLEGHSRRYDRGTQPAPVATELDAAPRFERFVVVACPEPFVVREMVVRVNDGDIAPCTVDVLQLSKP